jgi:hypothetical protein
MLHVTVIAFPASAIMAIAGLLFVGLGIGSLVEYSKSNATVGKKLGISSGTFGLVTLIAFLIWKITR